MTVKNFKNSKAPERRRGDIPESRMPNDQTQHMKSGTLLAAKSASGNKTPSAIRTSPIKTSNCAWKYCVSFSILGLLFCWLLARQTPQSECSHGLAMLVKLGSPLGLCSELCTTPSPSVAHSDAELDHDPTGIIAISQWKDNSDNILAVRKDFAKMSNEVSVLIADTETWQDMIPNGEHLHALALNYSTHQFSAEDQIEQLFTNHTIFVDFIIADVQTVSDTVQKALKDYGHGAMSNLWYAWYHGLSEKTVAERVRSELRIFAEHQLGEVERLVRQTIELLAVLRRASDSRSQVAANFKKEWMRYSDKCIKETEPSSALRGFYQNHFTAKVKNPGCQEWDPVTLQEFLKQEPVSFFDNATEQLETTLSNYLDLQNRYNRVAASLKDSNSALSRFSEADLHMYQDRLATINKKVLAASATLEKAFTK